MKGYVSDNCLFFGGSLSYFKCLLLCFFVGVLLVLINCSDEFIYKFYYCESLYGLGFEVESCLLDEALNVQQKVSDIGSAEFRKKIQVVERGLFIAKSFFWILNFMCVLCLVWLIFIINFRK